jgi:hypothetical protein
MVQKVEHIFCKFEALTPNPPKTTTTKEKQNIDQFKALRVPCYMEDQIFIGNHSTNTH